jgi:hypothetical protein
MNIIFKQREIIDRYSFVIYAHPGSSSRALGLAKAGAGDPNGLTI